MPMWGPPTPPSGDGDVYCEPWARALYRRGAASDALLPPVPRRERERAPRETRRPRLAPRAPHAPPSLFERAGPRPRPRPRLPPAHPPHAHAHAAPAHAPPDWTAAEDAALRRALRLQRLPPEPPAALAPNWDWVSEAVADAARAFRTPRACRDRYDALQDPERARRKHRRPPPRRRADADAPRPPLARLDAMLAAAERRRAQPKRRLDDPAHPNPKHVALLADYNVEYDAPPSPMEVASLRADRIAKEKMKTSASASTSASATAATVAAAAAAPAPPAPAPQRVVVAAHAHHAVAKPEAGRRPRAPAPAPSAPAAAAAPVVSSAPAQLVYRQQTLAARHHLKILHHTATTHAQVRGSAPAGGAGGAGGEPPTLRTLQLQQLAVRRAPAPAPASAPAPAPAPAPRLLPAARPHHVVLTHLQPPAPRPPDPRQ